MAKEPKEYKQLSGRGMRTEGGGLISATRSYCTLWLGKDHLLLVDRTGFTESYKRFYFRDIQAVILRKTLGATVGNYVLGLFALISLMFAVVVSNTTGRAVLLIIGGLFAFFTLLNLWHGPSCVAHIKTAVQTEQLPPWNRLKSARKGLEKIRPLMIEAQGTFFPDELKAQLEERLVRRTHGPAPES